MLYPIIFGVLVTCVSVLIQCLFIKSVTVNLKVVASYYQNKFGFVASELLIATVVLWLILGVMFSIAIWSTVFFGLGPIESLIDSTYFTIVSFTTLGYGDLTITDPAWRLFASFMSINGLFVFGINTAFFIEFINRVLKFEPLSES